MQPDFGKYTLEENKIRIFSQLIDGILNAGQAGANPSPFKIPFHFLLEFVRHFPQFIPALKENLVSKHVEIFPNYSPIESTLTSFESQIQNVRQKPNSIKNLQYLSKNKLDISDLHLAENYNNFTQIITEGSYSARIQLKQLHHQCQLLLERYAAPLNAILALNTGKSGQYLVDWLWGKLLPLQNPSLLTGCCTDEVASEGESLFQEVKFGAGTFIRSLLEGICDKSTESPDSFSLFNPSPFPRQATICISLNAQIGTITEMNPVTDENAYLPYQFVSRHHQNPLILTTDTATGNQKSLLTSIEIPAFGFKTVYLKNQKPPVTFVSPLKSGYYFLENDFVRLTIQKNGSLTLFDKQNQQAYENLNIFEDSGDKGTTAFYQAPEKNPIFRSNQFEPRVSLIETGPLRAAIRVRYRMKVAKGLNPAKTARSEKMAILRIWTTIYLLHDSPMVFFSTRVMNTIQQHRLRVCFASGMHTRASETYVRHQLQSQEHQAPVALQPGSEKDAVWPLIHWLTVADETQPRGLTLFTHGIHGCQLRLDAPRTLVLTLLRAVNAWTEIPEQTDETFHPAPEAQCQREFNFDYGLLPHSGKLFQKSDRLIIAYEQFYAPVAAFPGKLNSNLDLKKNIIEITPRELLLSCLKQGENCDELAVRVYNPTGHDLKGIVTLAQPVKTAYHAASNEQILEKLPINTQNNGIEFLISSKAMATFKLVLARDTKL